VNARTIRRSSLAVIAVPMVAVLYLLAAGGAAADLLCLLPALGLACVLLARRYPGERLLLRRRGRIGRLRRRAARSSPSRKRPVVLMPRGARLMGCSLAVRPPPASLAAS
jgi:hypothetical protein